MSSEGKKRRDILNTSPLRGSAKERIQARLSEPVAPLKNQKHIVSAQQWTFIQEFISNDGHITLTEAAIRAGRGLRRVIFKYIDIGATKTQGSPCFHRSN